MALTLVTVGRAALKYPERAILIVVSRPNHHACLSQLMYKMCV